MTEPKHPLVTVTASQLDRLIDNLDGTLSGMGEIVDGMDISNEAARAFAADERFRGALDYQEQLGSVLRGFVARVTVRLDALDGRCSKLRRALDRARGD